MNGKQQLGKGYLSLTATIPPVNHCVERRFIAEIIDEIRRSSLIIVYVFFVKLLRSGEETS
jgi:hypothetical protein